MDISWVYVVRAREPLAVSFQPSKVGMTDKQVDVGKELRLLAEDLCSMAEVAKELHVHVASVHRWRIRGVRGVVLETVRVGGKILTSRPALTRFLQRIQSPTVRAQRPTRPGQKSRDY